MRFVGIDVAAAHVVAVFDESDRPHQGDALHRRRRRVRQAASYAGTVQNTDKFFVHYLARDCEAIQGLTDGQCSTITEDMVPPLGEGKQGLFSPGVRNYVRPGTERGPLSSEQLRPWIIRFAQP